MNKKLAVFFPGIGYTLERPLLYYSKRLAEQKGYEAIGVAYGGFPKGVRGDETKKRKSFDIALAQSEEILKDIDFAQYEDVVFVSKSVGTIVAACYAHEHKIAARHIFFTPLDETFLFGQKGVAFHGNADPWADTADIKKYCAEAGMTLHIYEGANHSIETGDVLQDLKYLTEIMNKVEAEL